MVAAAKPDDLCAVNTIHMMEGKNQLLEDILWLEHEYYGMHAPLSPTK